MRLAVVQRVLPPYRVPFFRALAGRCELTVHAGRQPGSSLPDAAPEGFRLEPAPWREWRGLYVQPAQIALAASGRADVLVLSWETRSACLVPALALARLSGLPVLLWGHGYSKRESAVRLRARNAVGRMAAGTLFYSQPPAARCIAAGFDPARVFVAPNAIDQAPIAAAQALWPAERLEAFQRTHALAPGVADGGVLLYSSRLEADNSLADLFDAFGRLLVRRPRATLVLIGGGPARDALERAAAPLGRAVRFVGACFDEPSLAPWFLSADLFAYPDAIGLSLLHAFGYGLPVVTRDDLDSHGPEIVALEPGVNGELYRRGDAADLAAVLEALLADPARRARQSAAARATAARFSIDAMTDGFIAAARAVAHP